MWKLVNKELRNLDEQMLSYKELIQTMVPEIMRRNRSTIINTMEPEVKPGYKSINTFSNISMMV